MVKQLNWQQAFLMKKALYKGKKGSLLSETFIERRKSDGQFSHFDVHRDLPETPLLKRASGSIPPTLIPGPERREVCIFICVVDGPDGC